MMNDNNLQNYEITAASFEFAQKDANIHDTKLETKPVSYLRDAWRRFKKDKSAVAGGIIILFLVLFAIFAPVFGASKYTKSLTDTTYLQYSKLLPKSNAFKWLGWDGCEKSTLNENKYHYYNAIGVETGCNPINKIINGAYSDVSSTTEAMYYDVKLDSYYANGMLYLTVTPEEYEAIQAWQNENQIQVIYPAVKTSSFHIQSFKNDANIWYEINNKGTPIVNADGSYNNLYKTTGNDGDYDSLRIESDPYLTNGNNRSGAYRYASVTGSSDAISYKIRVFKYTYFQYKYGEEPCFAFGTNAYGQDILTRLGAGARFSFLLAIFVSLLNLTIGAIYGAVEGYFGGAADMLMERLTDILGGVPFIVVTTLFQLHFANKVGPVVALLFAFVTTGWIGMAGTVRMQFYRYKNQEYILAARTLGAKDGRIMFKHIFPNAIGTIITGSVLVIPGVIFSESSLTYLGIVNLESSTMTSVGTMLASGKDFLATYPHIILFPAIFISLLMISFNLFGNGLRDAFNPSLRGSEE